MKKLNELQENSERQFTFSDVRNKTNEQKKYFAKEIETLKRNQKEILELKNAKIEVKNSLEGLKD